MRLVAGRVPAAAPRAQLLVGFNGATSFSTVDYKIGFGWSPDRTNWTVQAVAKILPGAGWESNWVKDPWLVDDGTQYVCFYTGYNGTKNAIGRATIPYASFNDGSWTKYASNPILSAGSIGDPDVNGCQFPVVHYDANDSPKWRMWYDGAFSGTYPTDQDVICYADSSDGITWTKHGKVIDVGTTGAFNDYASFIGCVYKSGSTWYVFGGGMHNYSGTLKARGSYWTTMNPSSAASYSAATQLTNYTGDITIGSDTFISNQPRAIIANPNGSGYLCFVDLWNGSKESCAQVTSPDLTSWAAPSALMLPFDSWDTISAENPSVIVAAT